MRTILGAVLAGGAARRFGADKALAQWRGKPLAAHAMDALAPFADRVVVIGHAWPGQPMIPDRPGPGLGPLGGIAGAIAHARATGADSVITVPCDVPAPPPALFRALERPSCWCVDHPVFGHWSALLGDRIDSWIAFKQKHSVRAFATAMGARGIDAPDAIRDVDTPEDLARLC